MFFDCQKVLGRRIRNPPHPIGVGEQDCTCRETMKATRLDAPDLIEERILGDSCSLLPTFKVLFPQKETVIFGQTFRLNPIP